VVVNLDIPVVEAPETVHWVEPDPPRASASLGSHRKPPARLDEKVLSGREARMASVSRRKLEIAESGASAARVRPGHVQH